MQALLFACWLFAFWKLGSAVPSSAVHGGAHGLPSSSRHGSADLAGADNNDNATEAPLQLLTRACLERIGVVGRNGGGKSTLLGLVAGLLLALLLQLVAAPRIEMRQNLALWHSVGTVFYVGQWLCALVCVIRLAQRKV